MKFFEKQALLDEFAYATNYGRYILTYKDVEEILEHFDDGTVPVIELSPQVNYDGLKRKYVVLKSDTGESVEGCFVLRPDKDKAAIAALLAYAAATKNQVLATDIQRWISTTIIPADPAEEGET